MLGAILGGLGLVSSLAGMYGANKAAKAQNKAAAQQAAVQREQMAMQKDMYDQGIERADPFYKAGLQSLGQYQDFIADPQASRDQLAAAYTGSDQYAGDLARGNANLATQMEALGATGSSGAMNQFAAMPQQLVNNQVENRYAQRLQELSMPINVGLSGLGAQGASAQSFQNASANSANQMANIHRQVGQTNANNALAQSQGLQNMLGVGMNYMAGRFK